MRTKLSWVLYFIPIFILPFFLISVPGSVEANRHAGYIEGEIIIKMKGGHAPAIGKYGIVSGEKLLKNLGRGEARARAEKVGLDRLYLAKLSNTSGLQIALEALNSDPRVEYAEPNYIVTATAIPNDPGFSQLWGMHNTGQTGGTADADIDAPEAWDSATTTNIVVGVIDTGVDYTHEDLAANMWKNPGEIAGNGLDDDTNGYIDDIYGWDWVNNDNNPFDDHGHGTHVSGTIGAVGNNGIGVAGVNWSAKIAALKFLNSSGSGTTDGAIKAVQYANMMGFKITSNSWGGGGFSQALYDAISASNAAGYLFVAAAGNDNINTDVSPHYPSSYDLPNVIAVAATDHNDNLASFSNYGATSVDLGAPGVNTYSTVPKGTCSICSTTGYKSISGTSMATPHVSGAAALTWTANPTLTHLQLKNRILVTTDPLSALQGKTMSGGRLNPNNVPESDPIPPAAVNDLAAADKTGSSVILQWTAVGDDGLVGQASNYDVRYSTSPVDEANFNLATAVTGEPKPQPSGSIEKFEVKGLAEKTTYYFAMKVYDNVGNASPLSNTVSATTLELVTIFQDSMESGPNGWTKDGLWHQETKRYNSASTSWAYNTGSPNYNFSTGTRNSGSLISPLLDLTNHKNLSLKFKYWYQTETTGTSWDRRWMYVIVGGITTASFQLSGDSMLAWLDHGLDMSSADGKSNVQIKLFFDTIDSTANAYEGWYVDDVTIRGTPLGTINNPPVASVGEPYGGTEDIAVLFDGTGSSDPDGDPLAYYWDFGDGAAKEGGATTTHTYLKGGIYNISLVVYDGKVNSSPSTTTANIIEVNDAPVAKVGGPYSGTAGKTIIFNGSGSFDFDGDPLIYSWDFGDGAFGNGVAPSHTYTAAGIYTVSLVVNDGKIDSATSTTTASVTKINSPPTANAGGPYSGPEDKPIIFDGSLSFDPDGDPLTYTWFFGDGTFSVGAGATTSHVYTKGGAYTVNLAVSDGKLTSSPSTASVSVTEVNDPPVANAGPDQTGYTKAALTFDGSLSSDEEGPIASYAWNFGDGTSANGKVVTHAYNAPGIYTATLTVTDGGGLAAKDTATVTVTKDVVTINKATYSTSAKRLYVEATSSVAGTATLTVVNWGTMVYDSVLKVYKLTVNSVPPYQAPSNVTVTSSLGGSSTASVTKVK